MKSYLLCLVLLAAFVGIFADSKYERFDEDDAQKFVQRADRKFNKYMTDVSRIWFVMKETEPWKLLQKLDKCFESADKLADMVRTSFMFNVTEFNDPDLEYVFDQIKPVAEEHILGRHPVEMIYTAVDTLQGFSFAKNIPSFSDENVRLTYYPGVQAEIAKSNNEEELKYYWEKFREKHADDVPYRLHTIYRELMSAANATKMSSLDFWMKGFNLTEMERLVNEIQPLYKELHAFIRNQLYKKYGGKLVYRGGPIPFHLFEQVLAQAWTNGSIIEEWFPYENLPPLDSIIRRRLSDASKMYKSADGFYRSLGFVPNEDENLFESKIVKSRNPDEGDCKPIIMDLTPDAAMHFCHKLDFRSYLQAHGYMGQMYYAFEKQNLPGYFMRAHHLEYPLGEAAILSASTFTHLKSIGLLKNDFEITDDIELNRLLRMAIHTVPSTLMHYVHTKVMADLFEGKIEFTKLNIHYWNLMNKYLDVEAPSDRTLNTFDFQFKFFVDLHKNRPVKKFYGEILGYQMYKRLCQLSGKYDSDSLHSCDFYDSTDAGDALISMMKLGSSEPMNDIFETFFPDKPLVSADSFVEYYHPIGQFLFGRNLQDYVMIPPKASTKWVKQADLPGLRA